MKKIISMLLLVTLLFTTVACLSSCAEDDGAEISVYLSERVYNFDPAGSYVDDATVAILHLIYEPLFTLDEDGDVQMGMAEDYEFEDETGDMIITLRESYWTNGKAVTAEDFVWAWKRIINSNNSFDCAPLLYDIKNARYIKTMTIPEGGTEDNTELHNLGVIAEKNNVLRISFENPDLDRKAFIRNLTNIALAPVNCDSLNNGQDAYWYLTDNMTAYCNGPFRIRDLNTEEGYFTLARNAEYHRPKDSKKDADHFVVPALLRTIWDVEMDVSDPSKKTDRYLDEMYDRLVDKAENTIFYMSSLSLEDRGNEEVQKNAEVSDALSTYSYIFNTDNPLFENATVRTVLSQVIDRQAIADLVKFGVPATGLISNGVWDATSSRKSKSFRSVGGELISTGAISIEEAREKLSGVERGTIHLYCENREEDLAIAEYVKAIWGGEEGLGYTVVIHPCTAYKLEVYPASDKVVDDNANTGADDKADVSTYYMSELDYRYKNRQFDVIAVDYQMFSTNALTALAGFTDTYHGNGFVLNDVTADDGAVVDQNYTRVPNVAGYSNAEYNALIAEAMDIVNLKERSEKLHDAEELLMEDMPIVPLLFNQTYYVKHKLLKNLDVNYYGFTVFTRAKLKNYDEYFFDE